jgi:hypothetical protein
MKRRESLIFALAAFTASLSLASTSAPPRDVLPFIADDYPKALAAARAQAVPIFVEAWAPW